MDPMKADVLKGVRDWSRSNRVKRLKEPEASPVAVMQAEELHVEPDADEMGGKPDMDSDDGMVSMSLSPEEVAAVKAMRAGKQSEEPPIMEEAEKPMDDGELDLDGLRAALEE